MFWFVFVYLLPKHLMNHEKINNGLDSNQWTNTYIWIIFYVTVTQFKKAATAN